MLMQIMCCLHKLRSITGEKGTSLGTLGISQFVPIYFIYRDRIVEITTWLAQMFISSKQLLFQSTYREFVYNR